MGIKSVNLACSLLVLGFDHGWLRSLDYKHIIVVIEILMDLDLVHLFWSIGLRVVNLQVLSLKFRFRLFRGVNQLFISSTKLSGN